MGNGTGYPVRTPNKPLTEMDRIELCTLAWKLCQKVKKEAGDQYRGGIFPSNIAIDDRGEISIGQGRPNGWDGEELRFIAPELYWNGRRSPASDAYSIGMVLYFGASGGHLPFDTDKKNSEQKRMSGEPFDPPEAAGERLGAIIAKATTFNINGRYQTMDEMIAALQACVSTLFANGTPDLEAVFGKSCENLSETERMMAAIICGANTAESEDEISAAQIGTIAETASDVKNQMQGLSASEDTQKGTVPETDSAIEEGDNQNNTDNDVKVAEVPATHPASAVDDSDPIYYNGPGVNPVVKYTNDLERERKIRNEMKRRHRRPIIAIIVLCLLLVGVAALFNAITSGKINLNPASSGISISSSISSLMQQIGAGTAPAVTEGPENTKVPETPEPTAEPTPEPTPEITPEPVVETEPVYTIYKENVSWTMAEQKCEALGGHLAVIHNADELNEIIRLADQAGAEFVWLGCHRVDGALTWVNGDLVSWYKWGDGEPSRFDSGDNVAEDYLLVWKRNGQWYYNDSRNDPVADYSDMYSGKIAYVCETAEPVENSAS